MSVEVQLSMILTTVETLDIPDASDANSKITYDGNNFAGQTYDSGSAVPVTQYWGKTVALSGGAATIDFTSLTTAPFAAKSMSGLKPQFVIFHATDANANAITITEGAANGHPLLGAAFSITLQPGQRILVALNEAASDISGTDKTIDLAGTGTQTLDVGIVFG